MASPLSLEAFLFGAAVVTSATVVLALLRLFASASALDWMMAGQLVGTAGIAALLLFGVATGAKGIIDLALLLALLAAFAIVAFAAGLQRSALRSLNLGRDTGPGSVADSAGDTSEATQATVARRGMAPLGERGMTAAGGAPDDSISGAP
jgi:multicomponent Na+:H+ antiporter subunit F